MSELKITPIGKRILVKPEEVEEKTASGLYIPVSNEDKKATSGTIVKLGTAPLEDKYNFKVGDRVLFRKYSPEEVTIDNVKYLILEVKEVLAVISK